MTLLKTILDKLGWAIYYSVAMIVIGILFLVCAICTPIETARALKAAVWE